MPQLRRKQQTAEKELKAARWQALMAERSEQLEQSLESFVGRLRQSAQCLSVSERQKVVRLLIKEIVVEVDNRITIRHCLPLMGGVRNASGPNADCYPLCTGSPLADPSKYLPAYGAGRVVRDDCASAH